MKTRRMLVVDDDSLIRQSLYELLRLTGYEVDIASDGPEAVSLVERTTYQVIIIDMRLPQTTGLELLAQIKARQPKTFVIVATGYGSIENAVQAMRTGAYDYVTKPINDEEIKAVIERALAQYDLEAENEYLRGELEAVQHRFCDVIGQSPGMQKIFQMIQTIAHTRSTVLLRGESGTGKRVLARAIHLSDPVRKDKPFVEVSCGALPSEILESELFGHVKGSFTTAINNRIGRFEMADGGTIFLDEIDAFSPVLQVKLLRFLQEREFERVGDNKTIHVDVRVIAATNRNLEEAIQQGAFREDLFYRLNVIAIRIPPLRDRMEDVPLLLEHFLQQHTAELKRQMTGFSKEAMRFLMEYRWPGNVRELENAVERSVILSRGPQIDVHDLPEAIQRISSASSIVGSAAVTGAMSARNTGAAARLKDALRDPERQLIIDALEQTAWNRKKAAELLGINRTTLYNKMREYQLLKRRDGAVTKASS